MKKHVLPLLTAVACLLALLCLAVQKRASAQFHRPGGAVRPPAGPDRRPRGAAPSGGLPALRLGFQYGAPDWAAKTVPLTVSVTPKAQTPGATTAALGGPPPPLPLGPRPARPLPATVPPPLLGPLGPTPPRRRGPAARGGPREEKGGPIPWPIPWSGSPGFSGADARMGRCVCGTGP